VWNERSTSKTGSSTVQSVFVSYKQPYSRLMSVIRAGAWGSGCFVACDTWRSEFGISFVASIRFPLVASDAALHIYCTGKVN
jgi:hypothetical protein